MKKVVKITSVLSGIMAAIALILGIRVMAGGGRFMNLAIFSMIRGGTIMNFMGNFMSVVFTAGGFGMMAYHGFKSLNGSNKNGLIWGSVMTLTCVLSVICSIALGGFNFGDIVLLALPAVYTYAIIQSA